MQICFSEQGEMRWAWTEGLTVLGQQEIAVPLAWPAGDWRDRQAMALLRFLESYLQRQPKRILPHQTLTYGWTSLRFRERGSQDRGIGDDTLVIQERAEPLRDAKPTYIDGAWRAIELVAVQGKAAIRNQIEQESVHPFAGLLAIICTHATFDGQQPICMARHASESSESADARDSGWFIGCIDRAHDHDLADNLTSVHLIHIVERFPRVFPYLGFPDGSAVLFEESKTVVFRPGENEGRVDEAEPFVGLKLGS